MKEFILYEKFILTKALLSLTGPLNRMVVNLFLQKQKKGKGKVFGK